MLIQPRYSASVQSASFRLARITGGVFGPPGANGIPGRMISLAGTITRFPFLGRRALGSHRKRRVDRRNELARGTAPSRDENAGPFHRRGQQIQLCRRPTAGG